MLNREKGAAPLYAQLEHILKKQIEHGKYSRGDMFPTERELMEHYQVSRVTVRQAMASLSQQGYIKSGRGIGTEVVYEKINEHMKGIVSLTEEMKQHNIIMQTTYCVMEKVRPGEKVAIALNIPLTERCYCLKRVRRVDGQPLVYTITYLKNVVELPLDSKYYMDSLYRYLREQHGINIVRGKDTLEAALPSEEVQSFLEIDDQMPIFTRTRNTFLTGDEVFEYSLCYYPGNRYKYTVDLL